MAEEGTIGVLQYFRAFNFTYENCCLEAKEHVGNTTRDCRFLYDRWDFHDMWWNKWYVYE